MTLYTETTDAPETTATPYSLQSGDEFRGKLSVGGGDWLRVDLTEGNTYTFGAVGMGALKSGVRDTVLVLHAADGTVLATDDNSGPGVSSSLTTTASTTGSYYIEVRATAGVANGAYGLAMTDGARVSYGVELGAAELYRPGRSWADAPQSATTVTYAFRATDPGTTDASGHTAPFHTLTAAQQIAAAYALTNYSSVANITFAKQDNGTGFSDHATILIGAYTSASDGAGAFANYPGTQPGSRADASVAGDMWMNTNSVSANTLPYGSYSQFVFLHELGHAMGLAHPGDYNAAPGVSITYANNAQFVQDSSQFTVMSYFNASATEPNAPHHYADTLMMYDIYAVQQLYGANNSTNAGDSIYGFHSNVGGPFDFAVNKAPLLCIWDGAGNDTLDVSGFAQAQKIDLYATHFSDVGGYKGNVSIAFGCNIENAVGGKGADTIIGNDLANFLRGGLGNDTLIGNGGNDKLAGNAGNDDFVFAQGSGRDTVTDFADGSDMLTLASSLWGGNTLSAHDVLAFASLVNGHVVFNFDVDQVVLMTAHSIAALESQILLA